ncbi:Protein FAM76B [Babesia bigemina]|uniref:Protein FAM76B n=1 Tax=Babesia bigemina TaxID=5866 RepID=A0A061D3G0_BABBI|nr:Protein FAM76B [Babesia bigemina]CDR94617.1 Protein FAM76B [Babesia bigemina]|eukprot:XP_012766803.1 Protein FAM76B [Babesia bigemina]
MATREELRTGVKIAKGNPKPAEDFEPKSRSVWDKIGKLEDRGLCMECERRRWKTSNIQVCLDCAKSLKSLTCCHCKISYVNHKFCAKASKIYKRELCLSCASNWATHNCDPKLCRLCNQWSAWRSTSECDRCHDLLLKYGEPSKCESCNNNAAFDRGESARQRVNDLRLCFLCTCNYKKNDYYNRKLLMHMGQDAGSGKKVQRTSSAQEDSPTNPDLAKTKAEGAEASAETAAQREVADLKECIKNLKRKYAELQEENIRLKKRLREQ